MMSHSRLLAGGATPGKYKCLRPNASQVQAEKWQYWVDDNIDGENEPAAAKGRVCDVRRAVDVIPFHFTTKMT